MKFSISTAVMASMISAVAGQTFSSCNPLHTTCPADTALGRAISVDFRNGEVDSFEKTGGTSYQSDGVHFTVTNGGDAPQLMSRFYIMFGKVSVRMRAAPGAGIVSSLVLQSDVLDEIDYEWVGAAPNEVQSNYFGKGDTSTWTRGAFHQTAENQNNFLTYEIDWTANQITWSIDGTAVRTLTPSSAETNQYPQTPMQLKFGAWSAGDPRNAQGTIEWAQGPTDYSAGPFSMIVESVSVTDYSTGTSYSYNGNSGSQDSIVANGGSVGQGSSAQPSVVAPIAASTSGPVIPQGIGYDTDTQSGLTSGVTSTPSPTYTVSGVPSGWIVSSNGKIMPISSATPTPTPASSSPSVVSSSVVASSPSAVGCELVTVIDQKGFPTTTYRPIGYGSLSKTYDDQGFLVAATCNNAGGAQATSTAAQAEREGGTATGDNVNKLASGGNKLKKMAMPLYAQLVAGLFLLA